VLSYRALRCAELVISQMRSRVANRFRKVVGSLARRRSCADTSGCAAPGTGDLRHGRPGLFACGRR